MCSKIPYWNTSFFVSRVSLISRICAIGDANEGLPAGSAVPNYIATRQDTDITAETKPMQPSSVRLGCLLQ